MAAPPIPAGPVLSRPFTLYFPSTFDLLVSAATDILCKFPARSHHKNRMPRLRRGIFFVQPFPLSAKFGTMEKTQRKRASVCVPFPPPPSPTRWQSCVSKPTLTCPPTSSPPWTAPAGRSPGLLPKRPWACCGTIWSLRSGKNCLSVRTRGWPVCLWSWARRSTSRATLSRPSTRGSAGATARAICASPSWVIPCAG